MKVFLDEAGNTGCVINNDNILNFGPQRHFSLCGVMVRDENDEKMLHQKYIAFKEKFQITDELKGSSLLTRDNNDKLEYFINNILDNKHFSLCYYDNEILSILSYDTCSSGRGFSKTVFSGLLRFCQLLIL